jgi:hypothetical protein
MTPDFWHPTSSRLPALLIGWPLRSVWPVSDALGARPVKDRNLAAVAKRVAGPMVATRAGPPISARPGRLRASPAGSTQR